ncbi:MAG: lipoprotein [Pseudomonadota bacterium]
MRIFIAILLASALLTACGQRGALYLPGEQREQVPTATPAAVPMSSPIPATTPAPATATDAERENARRNRN